MYDVRVLGSAGRFAVLSLIACSFLTACGGSITVATPVAPVFTSTPITQAVEGTPYSYQPAASGTAVTFSLTNAPTGATLSGNTISWTPTPQQSRVPDSFTVTATGAGGASATQSWTVTPSGTIRISWIDTLWDEGGSSTLHPVPFSSFVSALVPQPDGSFQSFSGSLGANGEFEIPNVPAGYYWLRIAPRATYWTSSSTFDMGSDIFVPVASGTAASSSMTSIDFSFTSLDPTAASGLLQFDTPEEASLHFFAATNTGSTTTSGQLAIGSNIDFSTIRNGFVRQYEPASFGPASGYVLGPELTLSNLSLATGGQNTISGALNPTVPASIHLSVQGSAWAPLFDHVAPTAPTAIGGAFYLSVDPYIAADVPNLSGSDPIHLIRTKGSSLLGSSGFFAPIDPGCLQDQPLTMDIDAGTVQYSDPFPAAWRRTFRLCHAAPITVPVPGTAQTAIINVTNDQTTLPPVVTVKPLLSGVLNPKINGADLFTPITVNSIGVTLSWDPPAIGAPFGYDVAIMSPLAFPSGTVNYVSSTVLGTAKTSMAIPPNVLTPGRTYLFVITALADGKANMETSPHRSSLPIANADVLSAAITTN